MKILPKKQDIDRAKAEERRKEIDEGLNLARSIDKLREARQTEEKNLLDYRANAVRQVQAEIASLAQQRDDLKGEIRIARINRAELLKPLNKEWEEINQEKEKIRKEKELITLSKESIKLAEKKLDDDRKEVSKLALRSRQNEEETEKAKSEAISLKQMAQGEYEMARDERMAQSEAYERKMLELDQREREYEAGIKTNEIIKKEYEEKEADLIIREKHLASQQMTLRIAKEALKK